MKWDSQSFILVMKYPWRITGAIQYLNHSNQTGAYPAQRVDAISSPRMTWAENQYIFISMENRFLNLISSQDTLDCQMVSGSVSEC